MTAPGQDGAPVVVLHWDEAGELTVLVCGDAPVRVLAIDEASPHDRVFEFTTRFPADALGKLLDPAERIGTRADPDHAAKAAHVQAALAGHRHLTLVEDAG